MNEELRKNIIAHKSGEILEPPVANEANAANKSFEVFNKGAYQGSLENGLLIPNGETIIVDNKSLSEGIIPGIKRIWLTKKDGILYDLTIHVEGACPKGKWDNKMVFQDESGDRYSLRIFSSALQEHTVNYHSTAGNIVKVTWDI